jgi:hypothetical protein
MTCCISSGEGSSTNSMGKSEVTDTACHSGRRWRGSIRAPASAASALDAQGFGYWSSMSGRTFHPPSLLGSAILRPAHFGAAHFCGSTAKLPPESFRPAGHSRKPILIRTGNSGPPTWPSRYIYRSSASFALGDASLAQHSVNPCLIANGYLNLVWDGSSAQGPCGTRLELIRFSRAPDNEPRLAGRGVKSQRVVYKPVRYSVPASTC